MEVKGKFCVLLLLFAAVFFVSASVSLGDTQKDPEGWICKRKCEEIQGGEVCRQRCEKHETERREGERGSGSGQSGGRRGSGGDQYYSMITAEKERDVRQIVEDCHRTCRGSQGEQERPQCYQTCIQERLRERGSQAERTRHGGQHGGQQQRSNNPFVFQDHHFTARLETDNGNVRFLQKFTDRSELFRGIENYRVGFLEAEPQTFVVPNHWDADALIFVPQGKGRITLIQGNSRRSHNIKRGDVFWVPAGLSVYLTNTDNNEKLVLAKILHSVSVPGELQTFFSVGENRESSFYNAFSSDVLAAAFDIDQQSVEKLFRQQRQEQGVFKKATEEQIRALSGEDEGRIWPFGEKKRKGGTFNIYKKDPSVANENGILHEVDSDDLPDLRNINVAFSFFNITQGSMAGPFYNTKATMVLTVANGGGRFEMACPHLAEQSTRGGEFSPSYERVSSELEQGTVVVVPAGHPVMIENSGEDNLEVIGFGLNSHENEWFPLAGRDNVMSQWEDEAVELTFGAPVKEVQRVIQKQSKRLFFNGPARSGRAFA